MIISHKYKFACMLPTKTGTTSMEHTLRTHYEGILWAAEKSHKGWYDRHYVGLHKDWSNYFVFSTVRNPYTHLMSTWRFWNWKQSFKKFVYTKCNRWRSIQQQLKQFKGYNPPQDCVKFKLDAFVRVEHMQEDFEKLPFVQEKRKYLFENAPKVVHWNKNNKKRNVQILWTQNMIDFVWKKRKADFEAFGYPKDPPPEVITKSIPLL